MFQILPWARRNAGEILLSLATLAAALAPWLRNRNMLRDFLDYGLMMTAAGRIEAGQRPYRDFISPLQSASYAINAGVEHLFGGTFQAMTLGNGIAIVLGLAGLAILLAQRMSVRAALLFAGAIVIGTLSQHTIIWYNGLGVLAVAAVCWSVAVAPTLGRSTWRWNLVVGLGLLAGGTNKLNFHAIALAAAISWTMRAGMIRLVSWRRVAATVAVWLVAGIVLPVVAELAWTGATWAQWKHNVIDLPFAARGSNLEGLWSLRFYLHPMHDYYGRVLGPVGAIVVGWTVLTAGLAWSGRSAMDRISLVLLTVFTVGATGGLMATNHEIIYVSLAAGMVLIATLWLGFDLTARHRVHQVLLLAPTVVLTILMWWSAWRGQRSQFGHSSAPRAAYRQLESDDATFAYLAGTRIPPDLASNFEALRRVIPAAGPDGLHPIFYGVGIEWLDRVWPAVKLPDMPLLFDALTMGEEQITALREAFGYPPTFDMAVSMTAWSTWPAGLNLVVERNAVTHRLGRVNYHVFSRDWLRDGIPPVADGLAAINSFGGNVDPHDIVVEGRLWPLETGDARGYIGTYSGQGRFLLQRPSLRLSGEVLIQRVAGTPTTDPVAATFRIFDTTMDDLSVNNLNWSETVTVPAGESEARLEYHLDARGLPKRFEVELPPAAEGLARAGFRLPQITHSDATPAPPPLLRRPALPPTDSAALAATDLLPAAWRDQVEIVARGVEIVDGHVLVHRGGEVWLRPKVPTGRVHGIATLTAPPDQIGTPIVRVLWSRGGRIEIQHQGGLTADQNPLHFDAWPAENEGWFGVLIDPGDNPLGVALRIAAIDSP